MVDPTLTITVDRTTLGLDPLVFHGHTSAELLGVSDYQPPAYQSRVEYLPNSRAVHGSEASSSSLQQSILGWDWFLQGAASEAALQAVRNEVLVAILQPSFLVTTQISGAPPEVWTCDPGSMVLRDTGRTLTDLRDLNPVYAVTLPCYPIPSIS